METIVEEEVNATMSEVEQENTQKIIGETLRNKEFACQSTIVECSIFIQMLERVK